MVFLIDIRKCGMYNNHRYNMKMKIIFILQKKNVSIIGGLKT